MPEGRLLSLLPKLIERTRAGEMSWAPVPTEGENAFVHPLPESAGSLVVRRLYDWSYAETEQFVADSLILRQFCRLYLEPAPDDTTLIRWAKLIEPATLAKLNERVVALARQAKVTRGRKLRVDGTVVATNIHYPTDASLLADGVRGISRQLRRATAHAR